MRDDRAVHGRAPRAVDRGADLLLGQHRLVGERPAAAAVLLGIDGHEQADLAGLVPDLAVDVLLLGPPLLVRRELLRRNDLASSRGLPVLPSPRASSDLQRHGTPPAKLENITVEGKF